MGKRSTKAHRGQKAQFILKIKSYEPLKFKASWAFVEAPWASGQVRQGIWPRKFIKQLVTCLYLLVRGTIQKCASCILKGTMKASHWTWNQSIWFKFERVVVWGSWVLKLDSSGSLWFPFAWTIQLALWAGRSLLVFPLIFLSVDHSKCDFVGWSKPHFSLFDWTNWGVILWDGRSLIHLASF